MDKGETIYKGWRPERGAGAVRVWKEVPQSGDGRIGQVQLDPGPSQELWNHSPDGFQWGYGGSGPAQLALALLLDATGASAPAVHWHQSFKSQYVAGWGDQWEISKLEILTWITSQIAAGRRPVSV